MNFASANRQGDIFCDPDSFEFDRPNANQHISLGRGVHYCVGARLAKFEAQTVTEILAQRLPSLRPVEGRRLDYFPNITFRAPAKLRVTWS